MKNKLFLILTAALIAGGGFYFWSYSKDPKDAAESVKEVTAFYGSVKKFISTTAAVQPQNRLEMKPPVAGRIDKILVSEGQQVKAGEIVALMSSTERAALLDSARTQDAKELEYWENIYKPIPIIAPIDGQVIVSTMQPGQTITQTDPVIVLSNRLIVQAQVDETDIGRVREGQEAEISLDAYPDIKASAKVSHIYHESKVVNNVTIYQVDILPDEVPEVFRSGMSANVRIIEAQKDQALLIPVDAVKRFKGKSFVFVVEEKGKKPSKRPVETGLADENNIEIISGLQENETVAIITQKYVPAKGSKGGGNPFMPQAQQRRSGGSSGSSK